MDELFGVFNIGREALGEVGEVGEVVNSPPSRTPSSGHRLQYAVTQRLQELFAMGYNNMEIERRTGVSRRTIGRIRISFDVYGQPYPPETTHIGRPRVLLEYQRKGLLEFLKEKPTAYIEEMQYFLSDQYNLDEVAPSTIYRYLLQARWSRKVVEKSARERSEALRRAWKARQVEWDLDQLVFLDESAANERTSDRKYGWSPINTPSIACYSAKRSERWSILPAMTKDGYIAYKIVQGAITSEMFADFLADQLLPLCSRYPGPRSVLIVDNASVHRSETVEALCAEAGVILLFLPPYSPDLNPIEQSFKALKGWLRKHKCEAFFDDFEYWLKLGIEAVCLRDSRGYLKRCGYVGGI